MLSEADKNLKYLVFAVKFNNGSLVPCIMVFCPSNCLVNIFND